ncbi:MAG: iron-sulfur cluster repair di-iron protein [Fimbriimonadaceae bacterium]|nr:iron-sulfur cluster repair di-iron protein [Fimbriimonadaceae bacterium]
MTVERTVGELVAERPSRAKVMERFGLDYCCGGGRPLGEACAARQVDPAEVTAALAAHDAAAPVDERDWREASLDELTRHIEMTHHQFLKNELPRMQGLVDKVTSVHGDRHDFLAPLQRTYQALRDELEAHMFKEEQILFPLCRQLEQASGPQNFHCGSVANPIRVMEHEHDNAGAALRRLRELTSDYQPPVDACNTFRAMYAALAEMEADLHVHIHKENNVLHPRAIALEAQLA